MSTHGQLITLCTIRLDGQIYGIDMLAIREANQSTPSIRVPGSPPEVLGLVNLRGSIYLLLDIRRMLGLPEKKMTSDDLLVVFRPSQGESFGILVDSLDETMVVPARLVTPREPDSSGSPISGIILGKDESFSMISPELMYRRAKTLLGNSKQPSVQNSSASLEKLA